MPSVLLKVHPNQAKERSESQLEEQEEAALHVVPYPDGVFEMHHIPPAQVVRDAISWLVALMAFLFVFVGIATRRVRK